jgi:leucyl-tRNA synthetase
MICVNELTQLKCNNRAILSDLLVCLSPFAPHISEELWHAIGNKESIVNAKWTVANEEYLQENSIKYPISFNGKMRFTLELPADMCKEEVEKTVLENDQTAKYLDGKAIKKIIVVPGKIANIVL